MNLPFQIDKTKDAESYVILMNIFRTQPFHYKFYEIVKYHLWGHLDNNKWYHNIFYLHDEDFLYFRINMENTFEYEFSFYENLEDLENKLQPGLHVLFRKETSIQ
jgi:hypothetical protein